MATEMYVDLLKQGFMKPGRATRVKAPAEIVACNDCLNWHAKGKHTADKATRSANRKHRGMDHVCCGAGCKVSGCEYSPSARASEDR